jgi:dihydrolipoamide dehydrogenase
MVHDVVILGCGPAGYYAALGCARAGFRTVVVEKAELGGTGLRWGSLPVKMMLDSIRSLHRRGRFSALTLRAGSELLRETQSAMRQVELRLAQGLEATGVRLVHGEGAFTGPHTITAGGESLSAENIVIATGTRPSAPSGILIDEKTIVSHLGLVGGETIPASAIVIGADVEGVELACLLAYCGSRVTVVEKENEILPGMDRELVSPITERLLDLGSRFRLGAVVTEVEAGRRRAAVHIGNANSVRSGKVVVTGARCPNFPAGLNLARVVCDRDKICVDERYCTSVPHIYAIGDINGLSGMAHAAIQQGTLMADVLRGSPPGPTSWPILPRAIFTIPEVAGAGFQARDLERQGTPFERVTFAIEDTWRGIARRTREGFITVLAGKDGKLLGLWVCGEDASEIAAPFGHLLEGEATVDELLRSLFIHPTRAEGLREAAWRLKEKIRGNTAAPL